MNGLITDGDWVEFKDQCPNGNVRLVQLADIGDGHFLHKSNRFMTEKKAAELKCTFLENGDILLARMPDPLGRACVFPILNQPCVTVVDVCVIRVGDDTDRNWLVYAINTWQFRKEMLKRASGTTPHRRRAANLRP